MVYKLRVSPFRDLGKQPGSNLLKASPPNWNKLIYPSAAPAPPGMPGLPGGDGWGPPALLPEGAGTPGDAWFRRARNCPAVPRPRAGSESRRTRSQELLFVLFSALCAPAAAASPLRPVLRLPPYSSSSGRAAPQGDSLANHTGDPGAFRRRAPASIPPRARGRAAPTGLRGGSIPHPAGHPRDFIPPAPRRLSRPPLTASEQRPGGTETRPAAPLPCLPAGPTHGRCVQQPPRPSRTTLRSWFFSLGDWVGV